MPVKFDLGPDQGRSIVQKTIAELNYARGNLTARGFNQHISKPIGIYAIRLDELLIDNTLSSVQKNGWIYVLITSNEVGQVAELHLDEKSSKVYFAQVESVQTADRFLNAVRYAENHEKVSEIDYEIRELRIPSLCFRSVWLHSGEVDEDLIIPFTPLQPSLLIETAYSNIEFFAALNSLDLTELQGGFAPETE